jgi:hypothetical protein
MLSTSINILARMDGVIVLIVGLLIFGIRPRH